MDPKEMKRHAMMLEMMEGKMPKKKKRYVPDEEYEKMMSGKDIASDNDEEMLMDHEKQEMKDDPEEEMNESPSDEANEMMEEGEGEPSRLGRLFGDEDKKKHGLKIMIALGLGGKKGMRHVGR